MLRPSKALEGGPRRASRRRAVNPFESTRRILDPARRLAYYSLPALAERLGFEPGRLPFCVRVLLESLVRLQGHPAYRPAHVEALARWAPATPAGGEIPFLPSRVLLQDFTGVPCVVDLAALRSALLRLGGDPAAVEPGIPVDLVIDHSVQLDRAGDAEALQANIDKEFERNEERYRFLRWGQSAFGKLRVLPPGLGICHQVNMEYLATCVNTAPDGGGGAIAFPDTLVGTDSHTVMINSMGVLGWGVGGIEAEAAMLGQPLSVPTPGVVGVRLAGRLGPGVTPTDLALTVTERLRAHGVVGRFVEFFGPGLDTMSLADRAPVANMAPEYGATMGFFPIDEATIAYLRETGREAAQVELVEAYARAQRLWRDDDGADIDFGETVEIDLADVEPCVAGPRRPQDRVPLASVGSRFEEALRAPAAKKGFGVTPSAPEPPAGAPDHGAVVIASITSCTNTSNPSLLLGAALLARNAVRRGLRVPP